MKDRIILSDKPHHIRETAAIELRMRAAIPQNDGSYGQALMLLANEYKRWETMENFEPTWLSSTIVTALHKKIGQKFVAGLVGISLYMLPFFGKRASLENAAAVVSEYSNTVETQDFVFWREGEWNRNTKPVTGDLASIKKLFRKYRNVAHICSAEVASADYLIPPEPFAMNKEADWCFISTCFMFQEAFSKVENFADWNLEELHVSAPEEFRNFVSLVPDKNLVIQLFTPWLEKSHN